MNPTRKSALTAVLVLVPLLLVAWIWFSALAFVPVPWPDDSAFYFVGRELFKWPPRWVMLPQAPFEPTYRIFNFNTMPLYPILVGLGRFVGIDGSHAIKFWPLAAYGLSGSLLSAGLYRKGLPFLLALLVGVVLALDPGMRWASVLVRPESLIGLCGVALVLGLALGFPERWRPRGLWHPVAALLAIAAYAHFNAIHLLFPVILAYATVPLELVAIGIRCLIYLTPWLLAVAIHPLLFVYQMQVQWKRLVFHNDWLDSSANALKGVFQDMGSPEPWPSELHWAAYGIWFLIAVSLVLGIVVPLTRAILSRHWDPLRKSPLLPAAGWIIGSIWLWENKPEVWFNYYVHLSVWTFAGLALQWAWNALTPDRPRDLSPNLAHNLKRTFALTGIGAMLLMAAGLFAQVDVSQASRLGATESWHWPVYHAFVDCIDEELKRVDERLGHPKPFRVWGPTFPDITVELSRVHPDWEFTRTNDFWDRADLAVQHGRDVEAVVVTEMLNWPDHQISAPQSRHPEILSVWMTWKIHFLNRLWNETGWKPQRYLCQRGRWQGFIFEQ